MPYWWGIMRRKQISMAATCTLLVALKNLTECLSLPSSSQHRSWRGLHAVITIVRDLLVCFFFSRPIIFLFSHFREGNVIKKIALTRRNLTVTKRICSIFVKCTLPKKKKKTPAKGLLKNTSSRDVFTLLDGSQEVSASSTACAPAEENLLISIKRYYFAVCYNGLHFNRDRAWHWWTDSHLTLDIIGIGNRMSESTLYLFLQYKLLQWT